jgi:hypothetical protein
MVLPRGDHVLFMVIWFQRERCEALKSVTIVGHVFSSMVKSITEEWDGSQNLMTGNGGSRPGGCEVLAW